VSGGVLRRGAALSLALFGAPGVRAADRACAVKPLEAPTVKVTPNADYAASGLWKFFFGAEYRPLWTTPVEVEVLDLSRVGGGLTPKEKGGGKQTRSLKFDGKDGRRYRFRSADKEVNEDVLPAGLKTGFAMTVLEDQNSSHHPAAPAVVAPLAEAAGLLHSKPRLVVMPDDPALGEFRQEFAGMLGAFEETPRVEKGAVTAGFEGYVQILDWEELKPRLDASPTDRIDARAFLKARLLDMLVGDWDRHWKQWDWASKGGDSLWQPVPKDRDQAFAKYDGVALNLARSSVELGAGRLANFSTKYPPAIGLMWNSRDLDRRLLAELDHATWTEVVAELQRNIGDDVIQRAACTLPVEFYRIGGERLVRTLKLRRDDLSKVAEDFFRRVNGDVDVFATAADEVAQVERLPGGELDVSLARLQEPSRPYFRRRFTRAETGEVRVYLGDGNDRVVTRGTASGGPRLRIVGGNGRDVFDESVSGGTHFYDSDDDNQLKRGSDTSIDVRPFEQRFNEHGDRHQDWGRSRSFFPTADVETDIGLILGAALRFTDYGFRAYPYRSQQTLSVETATRTGWRIGYDSEWRRPNSRGYTRLLARYSEIEALRFYGFGNETPLVGSSDFYHVDQKQYLLAPLWVIPRGAFTLSLGPAAKYSSTDLGPGSFVSLARPYGSDDFGQVGALAGLELDTREPKQAARKGVRLRVSGSVYPAVWSVRETFGDVHGDASLHLPIPLPLRPSLNFRVGAKQLFGAYPFQEAAYIGGSRSVRGMSFNRYAGDAYAFGNAELRLRLLRMLGVFALADAGRVFLEGESSEHWHDSVGGGLWLSFRDDRFVVSFTGARSEGHVSYYVKSGLAF
jgi:hypothetical protein